MLKRITIWLMLMVIKHSVFAFASFPVQCTTVPVSDLAATNIELTSVRVSYTSSTGTAINQFRIRPIGTSQWQYSTIHTSHFRQFNNLLSETPYEFQISYICPNHRWTSFSKSVSFSTKKMDSTMEEDTEEEDTDNSDEDTEEEDTDNSDEDTEEDDTDNSNEDTEEEDTDNSDEDTEEEDNLAEEIADTSNYTNYLILENNEAFCGDSTVCIKLKATAMNSHILTILNWDTQALSLAEVRLAPTPSKSIFYQVDSFHLALGKLPINFLQGWAGEATHPDTLLVASICFTPNFDQVRHTTLETSNTRILIATDSSGIDTIINPLMQLGNIVLNSCEGIQLGGGTCDPIDGIGLTTSSVEDTTAYIYNTHHNTSFLCQFRYRIKGAAQWTYTDIQTSYFRRLTTLQSGTTYEFQVNQECPDSSFSDYSISFYFSTHGESSEETNQDEDVEPIEIIVDSTCLVIDSTQLNVSTIKQYFAYVYTPQPLGPLNNQFRYRPVGTTFWFYTSVAPTYYRYLRGLRDGTLYEYQVSHECSEGIWSDYSGSYRFTTLPSINVDEDISNTNLKYRTNPFRPRQEISVFPNPSSHSITIEMPTESEASQIRIRNIKGSIVDQFDAAKTNTLRLSIDHYSAGLYIIEVKTTGEVYRKKWIKK